MSQPIKHPVRNGKKYCTGCHTTQEVSEFWTNSSKYGTLKPDCKTCNREKSARKMAERRMKQNPNSYRECDNCCHIWAVSRGIVCSKCGEEYGTNI